MKRRRIWSWLALTVALIVLVLAFMFGKVITDRGYSDTMNAVATQNSLITTQAAATPHQ